MHRLALVAALLVARPALADGPYRVDPLVDTTLTLSAFSLTLGVMAVIDSGELGSEPVGDRRLLPRIDQLALDNVSVGHRSVVHRRISDARAGTVAAWVLIGPGLTWAQDSAIEGLKDFALYSEAVALTLALNQVVKIAARRPRGLVSNAARCWRRRSRGGSGLDERST